MEHEAIIKLCYQCWTQLPLLASHKQLMIISKMAAHVLSPLVVSLNYTGRGRGWGKRVGDPPTSEPSMNS